MIKGITFSSDTGPWKREEIDETSRLTEEFFGMQNDSDQIPATKENRDCVFKNTNNYLNIIKNDGEIIGYFFILPCTNVLMNQFVNKEINEARLFEEIKKVKWKGCPESIYFCSVIIKSEFRRKGLASLAAEKTINKITKNGKYKPNLFYWAYSKAGEKMGAKLASIHNLKLFKRKD